ncbi:MAG: DUF971 domain-containing protein [Tepidisphaerales bacterium]
MTPLKIDLKRDEKLQITWSDGVVSTFSLAVLRKNCPCAECRTKREEQAAKKTLLPILTGDHSRPLTIASAEMVGSYAIQLTWTDGHSAGIYSFAYLRELIAQPDRSAT